MTGQPRGHSRGQGACYRRDGRLSVPPVREGREAGVKGRGIVFLPSDRSKNGIGITAEVPAWRSIAWNVLFVAVEVGLICWAHVVVGVSWTSIGLALGGVAVLGAGLVRYVVLVGAPRAIRRHHALLQAHLAASTVNSVGTGGPARLDEVVDSRSTPHPTAPSHLPGMSRAR
jgi:hypothetical protein